MTKQECKELLIEDVRAVVDDVGLNVVAYGDGSFSIRTQKYTKIYTDEIEKIILAELDKYRKENAITPEHVWKVDFDYHWLGDKCNVVISAE